MGGGICIIGSGFSAAALLLHLDDKGFDCRHVTIIGRGELGTGQAFGCVHDDFRLNVRAELMRVWPDRPLEFTHWAKTRLTDDPDAASDAGDFYRRRDFAVYMAEQLNHRPGTQSASRIESEAVALTADDRRWQVTLDDGRTVSADQVVLATGNPSPDWPFRGPVIDAPTLVRVPWRGDWVDRVGGDERVVVIGSGLTAMDTIHVLHRRNHRGNITLVAPDGLLPPVQTDWHSADALAWPEPMRASDFLGFMRRHIGDGDWQDAEWQRRFESLRVYICEAWQRLAPLDQARLMRRVGWLWSLARFRAGPQAHGSAQTLLASGQLTIRRDMVSGIATTGADGPHHVQLAGGGPIEADFVVNCSGAGRDPLVSGLVEQGLVAAHAGFRGRPALTPDLALCQPDGMPYRTLHALGPVTAHEAGDVVGAPGTATQAHELATRLAAGTPEEF
ncbi:MAG: hypothetical protein CNE93_03625 [SAR116 cluster bacterium MED-G06]|nr:MAG: hypothetical protein CNE93_03625 [SAR116 cluster bacterium MED-G06]